MFQRQIIAYLPSPFSLYRSYLTAVVELAKANTVCDNLQIGVRKDNGRSIIIGIYENVASASITAILTICHPTPTWHQRGVPQPHAWRSCQHCCFQYKSNGQSGISKVQWSLRRLRSRRGSIDYRDISGKVRWSRRQCGAISQMANDTRNFIVTVVPQSFVFNLTFKMTVLPPAMAPATGTRDSYYEELITLFVQLASTKHTWTG